MIPDYFNCRTITRKERYGERNRIKERKIKQINKKNSW